MVPEYKKEMVRLGKTNRHHFPGLGSLPASTSGAHHASDARMNTSWFTRRQQYAVVAEWQESRPIARSTRGLWQSIALLAMLAFSLSACQNDDGKQDQLLTGLLIAYAANPCNFQARPQLSAVSPSANLGWPIVKGRVLQANGEPVIGALVIAEDLDADGASDGPGKRFVSTFSGIDGTGTFYMSGLPNTADDYRLSVEPIDPTYDGRIDQHIDCFQNPSSFSAGYYTGPGSTVNRNTGSATSFSVTMNPSSVYDVGDIYIR